MNTEILQYILGSKNINIEELKKRIEFDSTNLLTELAEYRDIFSSGLSDDQAFIDAINNIYNGLIKKVIDGLSEKHYGMSIEMAIATKDQSQIKREYEEFAEMLGFDSGLQNKIIDELKRIANKINKRFAFDEDDLIHLIEASKNSNIQLEEDFHRFRNRNITALKQKSDGTYYLVDTKEGIGTRVYTTGRSIPSISIGTSSKTSVDSIDNIKLTAYPGGKEIVEAKPGRTDSEIMKDIMKNLFDNLELCIDTYKFFYTKDNTASLEKGKAIRNVATLADDSQFDFYYRIDTKNLPHLLGIQTGEILSQDTIRYFDGTIDSSSSALEILRTLLENKEKIIRDGGLVDGADGKKYQLFPWEKIILKTSSFMRGDFFKTCFCLASLPNGINNPNEKYASITPTRYSEDIVTEGINVKKILRDLINAKRQGNDFIFRAFIEEGGVYKPDSVMTGKAETITVHSPGKPDFKLKTLDRYRNALRGSDEGSVVQSIENEIIGKRRFTPAEQLSTGISVATGLGLGVKLSEKAYDMILRDEIDKYLDDELTKILGIPGKIK